MRNRLKRAAAVAITAVMLLTMLSASLASGDGEVLSAPVIPGLEDGGALLSAVDTLAEDDGNITVTFVIDNENYTNDPGSGETHLTTTAANVEVYTNNNSTLTFVEWSGTKNYKIRGTGVLCSYSIPSGTSLASQNIAWPDFTENNIGNLNSYSYSSTRSWATAEGLVCDVNTQYDTDTMLYLQLYENAGYYHLDYVCGEDNHSIASGSCFQLDQSIAASAIDLATAKAQTFTSEFCNHGSASGETLVKWQLKVTSTGDMVDLVEGLSITSEYVNEQYGSAIKAYAVWESAPVKATFQYGETIINSYTLNAGSALGVLPDAPEATGDDVDLAFLGWQYDTDEEGNPIFATANTTITADTVFTAVFGEAEYYNVILHDVQPNSLESDAAIDLSVQAGMTLTQYFTEWGDTALTDGTPASDCVWYTVQGETKTLVDLSTPVTDNMDLYTYTYQIVLTLNPNSASTQAAIASYSMVDVTTDDDGILTLTITAREGETLTAADFVVNGVDYSLYVWTDAAGNTVDIQSLITNGVTENITATSDGTLSSGAYTASGVIKFFVAIDNAWELVAEQTMKAYRFTEGGRYYLSSAQLESIYGEWGFTGLVNGENKMWHCSPGEGTIWGNASAFLNEDDNVVYCPIMNSGVSCEVYYVPYGGVSGSDRGAKNDVAPLNSFYTVTVLDPGQKVYTADTLPEKTYTLIGEDTSMTVEKKDGVTWQCVGKTDGNVVTGIDNNDGTITYTFTGINQPYVISPVLNDDEVMITYEIGTLPQTPADGDYGTPKIEGGSTYITVDSGTHTVLAPSLLSYFYGITDTWGTANRYLGEVVFTGWLLNGSTVIPAGTELDLSDYAGSSITLTAQWTATNSGTGDKYGSMVNFFVSLGAMPEGTEEWSGNTAVGAFTKSVYSTDCGVDYNTAVDNHLYEGEPVVGNSTQYFVLGGTTGTNLDENHSLIVSKLSAGYNNDGAYTSTYHATFPSDETVLRKIRSMVASGTEITINGHTITVDELTTSNFTIKWYVFKLDSLDGWHIDGILVAKSAELVVTKTFAGDETAIDTVKNTFSITVASEDNQTGCVHTGATLTTNSDTTGVPFTQSGNTYTWTVPVDQYYNYTVTETGYEYTNQALFTQNALYRVRNSNTSNQNTDGWVTYSSGVTVTGQGHNEEDNERLTVSFLNTYTAPGTVILQKVDAATGNLMPNVSFTIAKANGSSFTMYDNGNGSYSAESGSGTSTNTITTDSTGQAYLWIGGGEYTLQETVPTGYDDPGKITVNLEGSAENQYKVVEITSLTAANGSKFVATGDDQNRLTVKVKNYSRVIDLKVTKIWKDNENKPVTIQLYRSGAAMGSNYTVTFDGSENWTHTFENLPLYADGTLAQYSLREEALGDFKYSDKLDGGYQYYDVTYSGMSYLDASGDVTTDMTAVETIALSVTNERSTGSMTITKVDNYGAAVEGAVFYLYEAPNTDQYTPALVDGTWNVLSGLTVSKTATSDENGRIDFGTVAAGRYYIIEHSAPNGYTGSNALYSIQVSNSGSGGKLQVWRTTTGEDGSTSSAWVDVANNKIVNTRNTASVTIRKTVSGNMGDRSKAFRFTVTSDMPMGEGTDYELSADGKTATFSLSHDESVTLQKVPIGATLTVTEDESDKAGYITTVSPNNSDSTCREYTIKQERVDANGNVLITVNNYKEATPDTGVILDSLPYIVILACVVLVAILLLVRRRRRDDR